MVGGSNPSGRAIFEVATMQIVAAVALVILGVAFLIFGYFGFWFAEDTTDVFRARFKAILLAVLGLAIIVGAVFVLLRETKKL